MRKFWLFLVSFLFVGTAFAGPTEVVLTEDNAIWMNDYFDSTPVAKTIARAKELDARLPSKEPIYLIINSGGGSIEAGLELIDNLKHMNRPIHTISAFAASMGFQTVQGLGTRYITTTGTLMSHKARGGFYGEFPGQLDSRYGFWLKRVNEMDKVAVARTKGKHTLKSYKALVENEYWCQGSECISEGFADKVVNASCDKSLTGTRQANEKFIWGGAAIELVWTYDKCPLNTGELDFEVYVNGKALFKRQSGKEFTFSNTYVDDEKGLQQKINSIREDKIQNVQKVIKKGY